MNWDKHSDKRSGSLVSRLLSTLRQLRYPKEFRIGAPVWSPAVIARFEELVQALLERPNPSPVAEPSRGHATDAEHTRFLADIATSIWRLRQKMVDPETKQPLEPMRRAHRHLQATWDALTQAGVEIEDHTGQPFPEGGVYALKSIARQPTPGIVRETVIETVKPSIYYGGKAIQMGEVVVGIPYPVANPQQTRDRRQDGTGCDPAANAIAHQADPDS